MNNATAHSNRSSEPSACWHNGKIIPIDQAKVSVFDHGLLYGDGVFEGLRFYDGCAFKVGRHLDRLAQSCSAIALSLPFDQAELREAIEQCIASSGLRDGYMRILVTRGEGTLGLNPKHCDTANVFILAVEMELLDQAAQARGIELITASTRRMVGSGLDPRVKSLNYLHSILAKTEANHAGVDDALLLNQHGMVAECSAANIFIIDKNGCLVTPPCSDGALEGITRETVIELACESGIEVECRSLSTWDIYNATECFITGSAARLICVAGLDGRAIKQINGPNFQLLSEAFFSRVRTKT